MPDRSFLTWPFFEDKHRLLAERLDDWAVANVPPLTAEHHHDLDNTCRKLVRALGQSGWLEHAAPEDGFDVRSLCLIREILGYYAGLADFSFAMQGLGTGSITLAGGPEQKAHYLPPVRSGEKIAAFALSEKEAGSDVSAMATSARPDGNHYVIDGEKTWISNGGIADHYVVFARTGEAPGAKGLSAFVVDADTPGVSVPERIDVIAPHPLGTIRFDGARVPATAMLGEPGKGFKVAMSTLDVFRPTVGAAALGFARRALDEGLNHANSRELFGGTLLDLQMIQAKIAEMAVDVDASALLVYRAAWAKDCPEQSGVDRVTRESSMAKLYASEAAQQVIDKAVQIFGGLGVTVGVKVEELYREIRALRIYEGASEVQKVVIARQAKAAADAAAQ